MGLEIERKFLVRDESWRTGDAGVEIRQGYLSCDPQRIVRVRTAGQAAFLTVKGAARGAVRLEFEYEIAWADAQDMLALSTGEVVEKTRYRVPFGGLSWEVDEFRGANQGLVVAECELENEDQGINFPPWVGLEVTADHRYANSSLAEHPFANW